MTKIELITKISDKLGITRKEAGMYLDTVFETISEELSNMEPGDKVSVADFGGFELIKRPERIGCNPRTGTEITIPSVRTVKFKISKTLKERVNK